jgi:hypothetical protein
LFYLKINRATKLIFSGKTIFLFLALRYANDFAPLGLKHSVLRYAIDFAPLGLGLPHFPSA